jgi:hypothetical protein
MSNILLLYVYNTFSKSAPYPLRRSTLISLWRYSVHGICTLVHELKSIQKERCTQSATITNIVNKNKRSNSIGICTMNSSTGTILEARQQHHQQQHCYCCTCKTNKRENQKRFLFFSFILLLVQINYTYNNVQSHINQSVFSNNLHHTLLPTEESSISTTTSQSTRLPISTKKINVTVSINGPFNLTDIESNCHHQHHEYNNSEIKHTLQE